LLFAAYVAASWFQLNPSPSRFLDLSVVDDVFSKASCKCVFITKIAILSGILHFLLRAVVRCC